MSDNAVMCSRIAALTVIGMIYSVAVGATPGSDGGLPKAVAVATFV